MAFVVEDGTGIANANSYVSVAAFIAYWVERGIEMSQYTQAQTEAALVLSTDHVDIFYGRKFIGYKATQEQALQWPRHCAYDINGYYVESDVVPTRLQYAICEYAKRILADSVVLAPDPTVDATGQQVYANFEKVGPIEERITYTTGSRRLLPPFPKADALVNEFTWGTGGGSYRA